MTAKEATVDATVRARHAELGLTDDEVVEMYRTMVLSRTLDERMWILHRQGKVAFHISGMGQEGLQVAAAKAMDPSRDFLHPYYRDMALTLSWGMTPEELMLALYAKQGDPSSGARQMPAHYGHRERNIVSGSSPVATQIPQAVGIALATKIRGEDSVTLVCFGEGGSSKGDFHEGLNFAGVHKLPVIFVCENNQYAISVPMRLQMAIERVSDRAAGYGFPGVTVDGDDVLAVYEEMVNAATRARRGDGPTLVEAMTYRIIPHSSDDDDRTYRAEEEVEAWKEKDALIRFRAYLEEVGLLDEKSAEGIRDWAGEQVDAANKTAEEAPYPDPNELLGHVFAES